jgi:hypothetical protein
LASTLQVAFAEPAPPNAPPTDGSCNMGASWWDPWDPDEPDTGPGNANGVQDGHRGMYRVHNNLSHPRGYTNGAHHMDLITTAQCVP